MIGETSITDEKGDRVIYEYDDYVRLKKIRDKNNNISIEILSVLPRIVQCDLIQYQFAIAIPNIVTENADLSSLDINHTYYSLY